MGLLKSMAGVVFGTTALATVDYAAFHTLLDRDACFGVLTCAPEKAFHPVTDPQSAVTEKTMLSRDYGWEIYDPKEFSKASTKINFHKAFLEYQDSGEAWDPHQKDAIVTRIQELGAEGKQIYLVVYIHGWHHDADSSHTEPGADINKFNYFVARQADQLRRLNEQRGLREMPEVLGIYVGWRGDSITTPVFNFLTIGDRAGAADNIGLRRDEQSLYANLQDITNALRAADPASRALLVGHSLGGRILSRLALPDIESGNMYPFGQNTLMMPLEAAIGANCYTRALAAQGEPGTTALPSFMSVSSGDDIALTTVYPIADLIIDDCDEDSSVRTTAIGNYKDYFTHTLKFDHAGQRTNLADPDLISPDGSPQFPPLQSDQNWYETTGRRAMAYLRHDANCTMNVQDCYVRSDFDAYFMDFNAVNGFDRSGPVWNIHTDRNTIGFEKPSESLPEKIDAQHNGYMSTNLARVTTEFLFSKYAPTPPRP